MSEPRPVRPVEDAPRSTPPPLPLRPPRTALEQVPTPRPVRVVALGMAVAGIALLIGLLLLPWQQTARGKGQVIALSPADREQTIQAPIKGVVVEWLVMEGERVKAGQPLVELRDNDPDYADRLARKVDRADESVQAAEAKVRAAEARLRAEELSRDLAVAEAAQKVLEHKQKRVGEAAKLDVAERNLARIRSLAEDGIASTRELEVAAAKVESARATVEARDAAINGAEQSREKARESGNAKVAKVTEELEAARSKAAETAAKALEAETDSARQERRVVQAPRAGVVLRVHGGPGGAQVKEGDDLVTLVPEAAQLAVELKVDGNDLPLVQPGEEVRLIFEGWPAIQFAGWPELARGTFGGQVAFLDATDDGTGQFRVVVVPHPDEPRWPDSTTLRQGVRTKGWVMLGRVRLGYEVWRQVNGFPADPPSAVSSKASLPPNQKKPRKPSGLKQ